MSSPLDLKLLPKPALKNFQEIQTDLCMLAKHNMTATWPLSDLEPLNLVFSRPTQLTNFYSHVVQLNKFNLISNQADFGAPKLNPQFKIIVLLSSFLAYSI